MSEQSLASGTELADIDIVGIMRMIPHRYPFLLIDRVVELEAFKRAVGIKNVTINEPFFPGHFPAEPIMPGVLLVEAMAQTAAVLAVAGLGPAYAGNPVYFMGIDSARFGRGWAGSGEDEVRVEVSERGLGMRENVVVRDPDGRIRAWGSVHDRAEGRMLFVHIVEPRPARRAVADRCSDVLFEWAVGAGARGRRGPRASTSSRSTPAPSPTTSASTAGWPPPASSGSAPGGR